MAAVSLSTMCPGSGFFTGSLLSCLILSISLLFFQALSLVGLLATLSL